MTECWKNDLVTSPHKTAGQTPWVMPQKGWYEQPPLSRTTIEDREPDLPTPRFRPNPNFSPCFLTYRQSPINTQSAINTPTGSVHLQLQAVKQNVRPYFLTAFADHGERTHLVERQKTQPHAQDMLYAANTCIHMKQSSL